MEIILGAIVSIFVKVIKRFWKNNPTATLIAVVVASLIAAGVYHWLSIYGWAWETFVMVLTSAGAFHNFIIRRFER
ncbi:hypothetical protein LCGC14_2175630 [marine sediment metagenome]|uniref:Uncharacterized protein n=1 Tax=marine sediment metagenome TaxID=412755 RepID=A0A0F9G1G7_9ZZZZ